MGEHPSGSGHDAEAGGRPAPGPRARRRQEVTRSRGPRRLARKLRAGARRAIARVRPGPRAWRGATWGVAVALTVVLASGGLLLDSGRPLLFDLLTVVVLGWVVAGLATGTLLLLGRLLAAIPPRLRALGPVAVVLASVPFALGAGPSALLVGLALVLGAALVGAGVGALATDAPPRGPRLAVAVLGLLVGAGALTAVAGWLLFDERPGDGETLATAGPHDVVRLAYGSGTDERRAVYGEGVDVATEPVDGRALLPGWSGLGGALRTGYWGFGPEALPRNARVWLPDVAEGRFPLVLIVHGNAPMESPSERGYDWLAEHLAAQGHVVASVDENFLNLSFTRGWELGEETDARAWLLLRHLALWRDWVAEGHPLGAHVDLGRIVLVGHSRGGEAAATAAAFDRLERYPEDASVALDAGFGIDAVVALAPVDGQYEPGGRPRELDGVSYLVLHGGRDGDVVWFSGLAQYHRTRPGEGDVKAAVHLRDANHAGWNTVWGEEDFAGPAAAVLEAGEVLPATTQQAAALAAVDAFLPAALGGERDALTALADPAAAAWPDEVVARTRLAHGGEVGLLDLEGGLDPAAGALPGATVTAEGLARWREVALELRLQDADARAVELAWTEPGGRWGVDTGGVPLALADPVLRLDLAVGAEPPPGADAPAGETLALAVEVVDADGRVARADLDADDGLAPAPDADRLKAPLPDWAPGRDPLARSVVLPVGDLEAEEGFDAGALAEVRLVPVGAAPGTLLVLDVALGPR
ncbi:MAG: hypothetical protein R6T85_11965 [Egibacteraceae bacterium]